MDIPQLAALLDEGRGKLYNQAVCRAAKDGAACYTHTVSCPEDALFDLASISKLLTATMVLRLVAKGRLTLGTTLLQGLGPAAGGGPGPLARARLGGITVEQALLHASGLPAWYPFYTGASFWNTLEKALEENPPAEGTLYSDINFILLGQVVQAVSGQALPGQLEEINRMLGTRFTYNPQNRQGCVPTEYGNQIEMGMCAQRGLAFLPVPPRRTGWRSTDVQIQGQVNDGNAFYAFEGTAGHAGVFGTAHDLLRLGGMYLESAAGEEGMLPRWLANAALQNAGSGRGLGFDTGEIFPHGAGHTGFTGTALWLCPQKNLCAVLLASRLPLPGPPDMQPLRKQVFTLMYQSLG